MGDGDIEVVQDVAVLGVTTDGPHISVGLYGGPENVCATVRFTFADPADRRASDRLLRAWERAGTPLSLVLRGEVVQLLCERALLGRALESSSSD